MDGELSFGLDAESYFYVGVELCFAIIGVEICFRSLCRDC